MPTRPTGVTGEYANIPSVNEGNANIEYLRFSINPSTLSVHYPFHRRIKYEKINR